MVRVDRSNATGNGVNDMVTYDCPWCAEPAMAETDEADELSCVACGVRADLAPDPVVIPIAQAA